MSWIRDKVDNCCLHTQYTQYKKCCEIIQGFFYMGTSGCNMNMSDKIFTEAGAFPGLLFLSQPVEMDQSHVWRILNRVVWTVDIMETEESFPLELHLYSFNFPVQYANDLIIFHLCTNLKFYTIHKCWNRDCCVIFKL